MTLLTWVKLTASPYPDNSTNWTILDCEQYQNSGLIVRVDGQTCKLFYRASAPGRSPESFSGADLANHAYHHLAVARQGQRVTLFIDGLADTSFTAEPPATPTAPLKISTPGQPFQGLIRDLAIYDRGFSRDEVLGRYKREAEAYGKDTSWFGTFQLEPFLYPDQGKAIVAVNLMGLLPLAAGAKAAIELGPTGGAAMQQVSVDAVPDSGQQDCAFDLAGLAAGEYEIRAVLRDAAGQPITRQAVQFHYPPAPPTVVAPDRQMLPPLAPPVKPVPFTVAVTEDGGLAVRAQGASYRVAAAFSYPNGGFNVLGEGDTREPSEAEWQPRVEQTGPAQHRITAAAKHYSLSRVIEVQTSRILVQDTIANRTAQPLGVLVRNVIDTRAAPPAGLWVAGYSTGGEVVARPVKANPTIFLSRPGAGLGVVALDDVFIVQSLATVQGGMATLHSDTFALDGNASYTLEWAIYPTASSDYYDFINQLRRDEGRNGTIDGGLGFISRGPRDRRGVPTREFVELRNLKYGIIHCLSFAADDPGVSIEGIEFIDFPQERKLLREQVAAIHQAFPAMRVTFHIAHSLYATNRPHEVFPDSRVVNAEGQQAVYTSNPGSYFSRERFEQGWNWYIYYPTPENSFGRALLASVDTLMGEIGADGAFMDGFMWAYGGEYTYDRWDGHTARIDPQTKTIIRTMGSVLLLSQDALVAFARKIRDRGGVVIGNNSVITRTIGRENYILHDRECFPGPEVHLASTPTALSLPAAIRSEPDLHRDVLDKLKWGNLYIYYQEGQVTHPSLPARMYPIALEEIHAGYVKGTQRLVTMRSGLYGWPGDQDLHLAYLYDARGVGIPHAFLTTVDADGVRTQVDLAQSQAAVVLKIPAVLAAAGPVNALVRRYDSQAVEVMMNGSGRAVLTLRSGDFAVAPDTAYEVEVAAKQPLSSDAAGVLSVALELAGQTTVRVCRPGP
jgi:hypothetical protein